MLEHVAETMNRYQREFPENSTTVESLRAILDAGANVMSRHEFQGHITCGAILVGPQRRLLMIRHRALDKWLFPGGHLEDTDPFLRDASLRELVEETGLGTSDIEGLRDWPDDLPIHIESHSIPASEVKIEPEHLHWDFRFLFQASSVEVNLQEDEVSDWAWVAPNHGPPWVADRLRLVGLGDGHDD